MFSLLIIGFSAIVLGLNIFLNYTTNPWFNASFLIIIIIFCIIACVSFTRRQNIASKQEFTIKEILHSLGVDKTDINLSDIRSKIDVLKQKNTKYKNDNSHLKSEIKSFSNNFKIIIKLFNYIKEQDDELSNELIQTLKNGINKDYENTKHILNEVGSYKTNYDNVDEKKVFYDGCVAAIVTKNPLQAFLLKLYLLEFGISSNIFNDNNIYHDCFNVIFIDEELATNDKPNMIFVGTNNRQNRFYINDILNKNEIKYALSKFLSNKQIVKYVESAYNVLIFGKSDFKNRFMLGMSNTCSSGNNYVNSITDFKKELKNKYKIIIVDYEAIKYDYESIKSALIEIKSSYNYLKVILILGDNYENLDYRDFTDITLKEDISQSNFIKMIKDNL